MSVASSMSGQELGVRPSRMGEWRREVAREMGIVSDTQGRYGDYWTQRMLMFVLRNFWRHVQSE